MYEEKHMKLIRPTTSSTNSAISSSTVKKTTWLKYVLLFKIFVCIAIWGLPALFGPAYLLKIFGVILPTDPIFVRMFGAVITAEALLYYFAYRDPTRNREIITYAVVDNGLGTLALIGVAVTTGITTWFFWFSGALTAFFAVTFYFLRPSD